MTKLGSERLRISRRHALAAGVALAAAAGTGWLWKRNDPLALAGIEFVMYEEPAALLGTALPDAAAWLRAAAQSGVSPSEQLGELRYFGVSGFRGATAYHAVVKNCYGRVTLLLISGGARASRAGAAAHGLEAVITPIRRGNLVFIAASSRAIACAEANLLVA